jgi:hypothetical protein
VTPGRSPHRLGQAAVDLLFAAILMADVFDGVTGLAPVVSYLA